MTKLIIFNVICVILSITIIIFDGDSYKSSFINNTGLNENNCLNSLLDNVSTDFENECDIIIHSKYCTDVDFQEILQEANCDICIVNLNCLNLKTRFDQLNLFLADTDKLSQIPCITLQCTCFDEHADLALHSIP